MRHLDVCSGIAGFAQAASKVWGKDYENVGHSEVEPFPCKVYHKHFPESRCLGDVRQIKFTKGSADLFTAGVPCQPASVAGKRRGKEDDRWLWPQMLDAVCAVEPRWAIIENPTGIITMALHESISRLEGAGFEVETYIIPACAVGAWHRRDRVWVVAYHENDTAINERAVAYSNSNGAMGEGERRYESCDHKERDSEIQIQERNDIQSRSLGTDSTNVADPISEGRIGWSSGGDSYAVGLHAKKQKGNHARSLGERCDKFDDAISAHANSERGEQHEPWNQLQETSGERSFGWSADGTTQWSEGWLPAASRLCRMDDGLSRELDSSARIKALGNAIVPQVAMEIMYAMKQYDEMGSRL